MNSFLTILRYELRRAWREGVMPLLGLSLLLVTLYATWNGRAWVAERQRALDYAARDARDYHEGSLGRMTEQQTKRPESAFSAGGIATGMIHRVSLPVPKLAVLTIGQADGYPFDARFSYNRTHEVFALQPATIDNPAERAAGTFDLAFVVVFLLPIFLLASVYDVWVSEHEAGTSRLLLSQPIGAGTLLAGKLTARGGTLLLGFMGLLTSLLTWSAPGLTDIGGLLGCAAVVLLYGLFWLLIAAALNVYLRSATAAALACGAVWIGVVALLPAGLSAIRDLARPAPSYAAEVSAMR